MLIEEGVSHELAQLRKATIDKPEYRLKFRLADGDCSSRCEVSFELTTDCDAVQLDYATAPEGIKSVTVNDIRVSLECVQREHIVINKSLLRKEGRNVVSIDYSLDLSALHNRNDLIYTLSVPDRARRVFPCFDQPDLKAVFRLSLEIPSEWTAVSNAPTVSEQPLDDGFKRVEFSATHPLPTYLFAFAAGKLLSREYKDSQGHIAKAYFQTSGQTQQVDILLQTITGSIDWMERWTGIKYPFKKYETVLISGFEFAGMENPGVTYFKAESILLPENATLNQLLQRTKLIAHEVSHIWFGDYVTMRWFDEVWIKEVFANYFAAEITRSLHPEFDHDIEFIRRYVMPAMALDRTEGRTAITQRLPNLNQAGLVYNKIIYNKAAVVMAMIVRAMGKENFQRGIQSYMRKFPYGNASWANLLTLLQAQTSVNLSALTDTWINVKGFPVITAELSPNAVTFRQRDVVGNGNLWPLRFSFCLLDRKNGEVEEYSVTFASGQDSVSAETDTRDKILIPNTDGNAYGIFELTPDQVDDIAAAVSCIKPIARLSVLLNLHELYLAGKLETRRWAAIYLNALKDEDNVQISEILSSFAPSILQDAPADVENELFNITINHPVRSVRVTLLRALCEYASLPAMSDTLYDLWEHKSSPELNDNDYMDLAFYNAIRFPLRSEQIFGTARTRINGDRQLKTFDYIVAALSAPMAYVRSLKDSTNRAEERLVLKALGIVSRFVKENQVDFIDQLLSLLPDVQRTGSIFFPANWCHALLQHARTPEIPEVVNRHIKALDSFRLLQSKLKAAIHRSS